MEAAVGGGGDNWDGLKSALLSTAQQPLTQCIGPTIYMVVGEGMPNRSAKAKSWSLIQVGTKHRHAPPARPRPVLTHHATQIKNEICRCYDYGSLELDAPPSNIRTSWGLSWMLRLCYEDLWMVLRPVITYKQVAATTFKPQ